MRGKKLTALLLSGMIAASALTGCGVDKNAVVATLDETEVTLGVANFTARLEQAQYDDFYTAYFGKDVWSSDLYQNGSTLEQTTKTNILESIHNLYLLQAHMDEYGVTITEEEKSAIADAAAEFISDNDQKALDALGADQAIVEEYLTLVTIQNKMHELMVADADTNVSDEEANVSAYSYVRVSKVSYKDAEGNTVEYTEEEKELLGKTVEAFAAAAKEETLEKAAEANEYTVSEGTFTAEDTTLDETILAALKELEEGEVSGLVQTENNYYVLRLDAATDAEATEENRKKIVEARESELYKEILAGWAEASEWNVDEKVWAEVKFDNLFTTVEPSTDTESVGEPTTESVQ